MGSFDFYQSLEPVAGATAAPYHFAGRLSPQLMRCGFTSKSAAFIPPSAGQMASVSLALSAE
jgi:hypothetical protein